MKKSTLANLAAMGIASGLLFGCNGAPAKNDAPQNGNGDKNGAKKAENGKADTKKMTGSEQGFHAKLNQWGKTTFKNMDADSRALAMKTAAHDCKGQNECKGLGGCKTDSHECAGKNDCKGNGGCKTDHNKAVKLVKDKKAAKAKAMTDSK